jgi:hypothetical protein
MRTVVQGSQQRRSVLPVRGKALTPTPADCERLACHLRVLCVLLASDPGTRSPIAVRRGLPPGGADELPLRWLSWVERVQLVRVLPEADDAPADAVVAACGEGVVVGVGVVGLGPLP